ncbi:DinB family protein [Dyadobacter sp. NIV53]|uniref:DinB family protein n=1 Tax=Dyadobacter sp. NIV53 TaxID=2861765 RepID=UPI001C8817CB|nr:DinB family protein [Dyadobacter sp. NIV53]
MNDYFIRLFRYNDWANKIIGNYLLEHAITDHDCVKLLSHILLAQVNWYKRTIGRQDDVPVWSIQNINPEMVIELESNGKLWADYIRSLNVDDFGKLLSYKNMAGVSCQTTIQDTLCHMVNHGTYHRGQIIRRIRELDLAPPSTDYILFARFFPA